MICELEIRPFWDWNTNIPADDGGWEVDWKSDHFGIEILTLWLLRPENKSYVMNTYIKRNTSDFIFKETPFSIWVPKHDFQVFILM